MVCLTDKGPQTPIRSGGVAKMPEAGGPDEGRGPLQAWWNSQPVSSTQDEMSSQATGIEPSDDPAPLPEPDLAPPADTAPSISELNHGNPETCQFPNVSSHPPVMVEELNQLAASLLRVAQALRELDVVLHRTHGGHVPEFEEAANLVRVPEATAPNTIPAELQDWLRQYLFR